MNPLRAAQLKKAIFVAFGLALTVPLLTGAASCSSIGGSSGKGSGATEVEFIVTGSTADVTYGDDSSNYQGHVPMDVTKTLAKGALYEAVTAQLNGGGRVTCKVIIGDAVKIGHASGGYNICQAQLNSDPINGGWN